jgi:hypothetical protein
VQLTIDKPSAPIGSFIEFTYRFVPSPTAAIAEDYRVFVHVTDAEGERVWSDDHDPPVPTSTWKPGEPVEYTRSLFVPMLANLGPAAVDVGLYRDNERLRLDAPEADGNPRSRAYRVATLTLRPESENTLIVYKSGWHPDEFAAEDPSVSWKWTQKTAVFSFRNPRTDIDVHLEYGARPDAFGQPQQVSVLAGTQVIETFTAATPGRRLRTIVVPADRLGTGEMSELRIEVDRTFVPSSLSSGGPDVRELGLQVYHLVVESR